MENIIKSEFSPMLSFTCDSMDATGYYAYHSADSSPLMAGTGGSSSYTSSPGQSPPFYGSYQASPQYYLDNSSLDQSPVHQPQQQHYQLFQQQPQEFIIQEQPKSFQIAAQNNILLEPVVKQQTPQQTIPGINELSKLFNMASKAEDKLAIQAKIKQILFEHMNVPKTQEVSFAAEPVVSQSALITPPLSPNADNLLYMSKQNPMFLKGSKLPNLLPAPVKVEPASPQQQQQQLSPSKLSRAPYIDTTAANVITGQADNLVAVAGQSPVLINSSALVAQNSPKTIYFESSPITGQSPVPVQYGQYKMETAAGFPSTVSILVSSDGQPIPETVPTEDSAQPQPKPVSKPKSKSKKSKSKAKAATGNSSIITESAKPSSGSPKQSQKRSAHLSAEFRYRTKLNDKIGKLRSLVGQKVHLSKSAVLTRSIERIVKLQKLTIRLHESNLRLQSLVAKYTSPPTNLVPDNSAKLMSIRELTRSLSNSSNGQSVQSPTIDIDLAKYIDHQLIAEHEPLSGTSTLAPLEPNSVVGLSQPSSSIPTEEVFDFDQFLEQF